MLASNPHGATKKLLVVAHGFDTDMIAGLVRAGLAAEELEVMNAGGTTIEVVRIGCGAGGSRSRGLTSSGHVHDAVKASRGDVGMSITQKAYFLWFAIMTVAVVSLYIYGTNCGGCFVR
jgi:hypothetical protein